jgi:hypothetical protein
MPLRRLLLALAVALVALAAHGARAQAAACPTFSVLHDDRIGALELPAGPYAVSTTNLSCAESTVLFAEFLDDYDGKLRKPWKTTVLGVGKGRFSKSGTDVSFTVTKSATPSGGGGGSSHGLVCGTPYRVTRAERIQGLQIKAGRYRITRLGTSVSCAKAASLLSTFLRDFSGPLPGGWTLLPQSGAFVKGSLTNGFLIEPWRSSGGGGGKPIVTKDTRCPATFSVLHHDHIGKLELPAGPYRIYVLKGAAISCPGASSRFRQFLNSTSGILPSPWRLDVGTATFRRGSGATAFRVKPV